MIISKVTGYTPIRTNTLQSFGKQDDNHIPLGFLILGEEDIPIIQDKIEITKSRIEAEKERLNTIGRGKSSFLKDLEAYLKRLQNMLKRAKENSQI